MLVPFGTQSAPSPPSVALSNAEDVGRFPQGIRRCRTRYGLTVPGRHPHHVAVRDGERSPVRTSWGLEGGASKRRTKGVVGNMTQPDPYLGEIVGTATLILLGDGVVAGVLLNKSKAQNSGWIVITWAWGLAVLMGVLTSLAVSGGLAHLNPAVTIGFALIGKVDWSDVPTLIAGEFVGAFIGATLVWLAYLAHWPETDDKGLK